MKFNSLSFKVSIFKHRWKALLIICCILLSMVSIGIAGKQFSPFIQSFQNGWIDWDQGVIYGMGRGYIDKNRGSRVYAMRAARTIALGSIVKVAAGMNLDDRNVLGNLGKERVAINIKALVHPEFHKREFVENDPRPYYEVTLKTPVSGVNGLTSKLIDVFKSNPGVWKAMPKLAAHSELKDEDDPWLVLDARGLGQENEVQPALFPKITDESGDTVYGIDMVDENAMVQRGMAKYVVSSESQEHLRSENESLKYILAQIQDLLSVQEAYAGQKRKKRRRLIVKDVYQASGITKTNLVISGSDAHELKEEDASSQILKKCRVVVIVNSPIGGVEGKISDYIFKLVSIVK